MKSNDLPVDVILTNYALAAPEFSARVLQAFFHKHPKHAAALRYYACLQLNSVPASIEELERGADE